VSTGEPSPAGPPIAWNWLVRGWPEAASAAAATAVLVYLPGLGAVLLAASGGRPGPGPAASARAAGVLFLMAHHVRLSVTSTGPSAGPGGVTALSASISMALMTSTMVAAWILHRGGARVAGRYGRSGVSRAWLGAKVAVPYSLLCYGLSYTVSFGPLLGGGPNAVTVRPSHVAALICPLAIAVTAGASGGLMRWADGPEAFRRRGRAMGRVRPGGWIAAAASGAWRMFTAGLAFSFVALLGLAAVHPSVTAAYFRTVFQSGALRGAGLIGLHSLAAANMAAVVLLPSMGGCDGLRTGSGSHCLLSYRHFPAGLAVAGPGPGAFGPAPAVWLLFLLIPLVAVLWGGWVAGRRIVSEGGGMGPTIEAGLGAGLLFGALWAGTAALAGVALTNTGGVPGLPPGFRAVAGPGARAGFLVAVLWGLGGGLAGAFLARLGPREVSAGEAPRR
jgi:hypothetical protein